MRYKIITLKMPVNTKALIVASAHMTANGAEMRQKMFSTEELQDGSVIEIGNKKETEK